MTVKHLSQVSTSVPGITGQTYEIDLKLLYSITLTASYQANYTICTNRFASGRITNGGGAAVFTRGLASPPKAFNNSDEEKAAVMESVLAWAYTNANPPSITILSGAHGKSFC